MHYFSNTWNRDSRSNSDRQNSRGTPSSMKIIRIDIVFTDEHYMGNPFRTIRSKWSTTGIIVIYFRQAFILCRHLTIMFAFDYFLSTVSQGDRWPCTAIFNMKICLQCYDQVFIQENDISIDSDTTCVMM